MMLFFKSVLLEGGNGKEIYFIHRHWNTFKHGRMSIKMSVLGNVVVFSFNKYS